MLIGVVPCLQQNLGLFDSSIKLDPLLVDGLADAFGRDTGICQPAADCKDRIFRGPKEFDDFLGAKVLAILW